MSKKEKIIAVRVSNEEISLIKEKADKIGLGLSAYIRMLALKAD